MRLLTAGSLVRAQQGEPNKSTSNDVLFFCLRGFAGGEERPRRCGQPRKNRGATRGSACSAHPSGRFFCAVRSVWAAACGAGRGGPGQSLPKGAAPRHRKKSSAPAKRPGRCPYAVKNQSSRLPNSLRRRSGLCSSAQVMAQGEVNSSSLFPFRSSMRRVSLVRSRFLGSRSSFSIQRMCS